MLKKRQINLKNRFFFGHFSKRQKAHLILKKSHSNFFFTLTDIRNKVIICKTAAMILGKGERRRRRKSPQIIELMLIKLDKYLLLYNIIELRLILRVRIRQYIDFLLLGFSRRKLIVSEIIYNRILPYSMTRGRRKKY